VKLGIATRNYQRAIRYAAKSWHMLRARVLFGAFVDFGPNTRIERGVSIRPFRLTGDTLRVSFRGHNRVGSYTKFQGTGHLILGERSYCGSFCVFGVNERIEIGQDVMIADAVSVRDTDHEYSDFDRPMMTQGRQTAPVVIEDDVWLGHGVIVLKGVTVGRGAIVAAGSVVIRDVEARSIVAGVPARVVSHREPSS